jgi:hypothetical protein
VGGAYITKSLQVGRVGPGNEEMRLFNEADSATNQIFWGRGPVLGRIYVEGLRLNSIEVPERIGGGTLLKFLRGLEEDLRLNSIEVPERIGGGPEIELY